MKAQILNGKIFLTGTTKHSPHFGAIPASRWSKKHLAWTYPISAICAARIIQVAKKLGEDVAVDDGFRDLLKEWKEIRSAKVWKSAKGQEAAKRALATGNVFRTTTTPWVHQVCAQAFGANRKTVYYGMKMGTGKTLVAIEELGARVPNKTLILCPKNVVPVWGAEFDEHYPEHPFVITPLIQNGPTKKIETLDFAMSLARAKSSPIIVVINYESAFRKGIGDKLLAIKWDCVIFDEIHKLKSPGGTTSKWAAKLDKDCAIGLSGTPLPNNMLDAYGQFRALDKGVFGNSFALFRSRYAELNPHNHHYPEIVGWRNQDQFNQILDFYMFRVDEDVLDLPPFTDTFRSVPLTRRAQAVYNKLEREYCAILDSGEEVTAPNAMAKIMKLREVCSGFVYDDNKNTKVLHTERKKVLEEVLDDIDANDQVVIFAEFQPEFVAIKEVAEKLGREYGEVSGRANDLVDGKLPEHIKVLAAHPKSGGEGVQLQSAHYCIFYSFSYDLAAHWQARARLHRGGQKNNVTYIYLTAPNTVEPVIFNALKTKADIVNAIMDYVKRGGSRAV